jgi:hypothetical protein
MEKSILGPPTVLVAGAEGSGLRSLTQRVCHRLMRIPMTGRVESLNVSVAVALASSRSGAAAARSPPGIVTGHGGCVGNRRLALTPRFREW